MQPDPSGQVAVVHKSYFIVEADDQYDAINRWHEWRDAEDTVIESILAGDCKILAKPVQVSEWEVPEEDTLLDEDYQQLMGY